jgi:hypothetical protein
MTFFDKLVPVLVFLFIAFILIRAFGGKEGSPIRDAWRWVGDKISGGRDRIRERRENAATAGGFQLDYE